MLQFLTSIPSYIPTVFATVFAIQLTSYLFPILRVWLAAVPNLKEKYETKWALVTGGSSGIGKAIATQLAHQKLNVVIVAMDDELLKETVRELQTQFPSQQFRKVGAMFAPGQNYMDSIREATKDIEIGIVFNNAGYIATGFFDDSSIERQLANLECNATAAVSITHHFLALLTTKGRRGCFVYTSSASAFIPNPFACIYGATKAFLSQFAASLAVEGHARGIDFLSIHPSPVASRFYDKTHKLEALDFAKLFAVGPEALPHEIFRTIGLMHWRDIGGFAVVARVIVSLLSYNTWVTLFASFAEHMPDYQKYVRKPAKAA